MKVTRLRLGVLLVLLCAAAAGAQETQVGTLLPGTKLRFGGQLRARGEASKPFSYSDAALLRGSDFALLRTRLNLEAVPAEGIRVFAQLQDSRTFGSEASVVANEENVDLHEGYVDFANLWSRPLLLRVGRQELAYGDGRLISPLDWSNVGRAWDGVRLSAGPKEWKADLFVTNIRETADVKRDSIFSGLYGSFLGMKDHELDLYLLSREIGNDTSTGESGRRGNLSERTLGSRVKGKAGGADYSAEAAWQFGRAAGDRIRAWGYALTAGWTFAEAPWKPRLGVEFDHGSGDKDPNDNKKGTFEPLFPFGHAYQGYQDIFSWKNGQDYRATASAQPGGTWQLQADYHFFRLSQARDGWYDSAAALIRRDATGAAGRDVGHEVDLTARVTVRKAVKLWFGVTRFWNSTFVKRTGGGGDRNWAFLQATIDF